MLYELLEGERVTVTCGVPTMWIILTDWLDRTGKKFSKLRLSLSSGSAPPRALVEKLERDYGVELAQAWGMTEALGGSLATMRPGSADLPFEAAHRPAHEIGARQLRHQVSHRRR